MNPFSKDSEPTSNAGGVARRDILKGLAVLAMTPIVSQSVAEAQGARPAHGISPLAVAAGKRNQSFDEGWRFLRGDALGAEAPGFNDSSWRVLDLPHDWSVEDLPSLGYTENGAGAGAGELVAEGKALAGFIHHAGGVHLHALGAQRVGKIEVQPVGIVGCYGRSRRVDIRPLPVALAVHGRDLLATLPDDVLRRRGKAILRQVAGEALNGTLGHAIPLRIVQIARHHDITRDKRSLRRAHAPLAVVEIRIGPIVGHVARSVVLVAARHQVRLTDPIVGIIVLRLHRGRGRVGAGRAGDGLCGAVAEGGMPGEF